MRNFLATVYQGAGRAVKSVTTGFAHTCFLLDSNQVRCTGTNFNGQLGQGNTNGYDPKILGAGLVDLGPNPYVGKTDRHQRGRVLHGPAALFFWRGCRSRRIPFV